MDKKQTHREIRRVSNFSSLPILFYTVTVFVFSRMISGLFALARENGVLLTGSQKMLIGYSVQYLVILTASIALLYLTRSRATGLRPMQVFCKPKQSAGWCFKWIVISAAFVYIANFVTLIFTNILRALGLSPKEPEMNFSGSAFGIFTMFLVLSVFAPLWEEMLFRGTVCRHTEIMGQLFAVVFSGVMFGLWHQNYAQLLYTAVMGCFAAFMLVRTRSIFPSLILHFSINTLSAVVLLITKKTDLYSDVSDYRELAEKIIGDPAIFIFGCALGLFILGLMTAGVILFIIELVRNRRRRIFRGGIFPVNGWEKLGVFLSAPVTAITIAALTAGTILRAFGVL